MNKVISMPILNLLAKIRLVIEPFMFKKFSQKLEAYENKRWEESKKLSIQDFDKYINTFEYLPDKWGGFLDMSFPVNEPGYFFTDLDWGRDCDDFARIWALYLKEHGWSEITEVIVTTLKHPIGDAHVITVAKKDNKYYLFNYEQYGVFNTFDEAVWYMTAWERYPVDKLIWVKYKNH